MANNGVKISFIPKEPLLRGDTVVRRRPAIGLSFLIGFTVFALALMVAGGLYIYKNELYGNLTEKQRELRETNDQLEKSDIVQSIEELRDLRDQIDKVSSVLDRHVAITAAFEFLHETTLSTVSYGSFDLTIGTDSENEVTIRLVGQARSYADLANQSLVYGDRADVLSSYSLEGFRLTDAGTVEFTMTGMLNIDELNYKRTIDN